MGRDDFYTSQRSRKRERKKPEPLQAKVVGSLILRLFRDLGIEN